MVPWKELYNQCCDDIRPIIDPIHAVTEKNGKHPCSKKHSPHFVLGERINSYIKSIIPNNVPPPPKWYIKKTYKICDNLNKQINQILGPTIDANNINKEEEVMKKKSRYNLWSLDLD